MNSRQPTLFMRGATLVAIGATTALTASGASAYGAQARSEVLSPSLGTVAWSQQAATPSLTLNPSPISEPPQPLAMSIASTVSSTAGTTGNGCQVSPASSRAETRLLRLLNRHRAAVGVRALLLNASLSNVARAHACDMFLHQQLNHDGSDSSTPFQRMSAAGFTLPPYSQEGENVGMTGGRRPGAAVALLDGMMMAEPPSGGNHHWNIVNSGYSIVGLGVIVANDQTWLSEDFAG